MNDDFMYKTVNHKTSSLAGFSQRGSHIINLLIQTGWLAEIFSLLALLSFVRTSELIYHSKFLCAAYI